MQNVLDLHERNEQTRNDIDIEHKNMGTENITETVKNKMEFGEDVNTDF